MPVSALSGKLKRDDNLLVNGRHTVAPARLTGQLSVHKKAVDFVSPFAGIGVKRRIAVGNIPSHDLKMFRAAAVGRRVFHSLYMDIALDSGLAGGGVPEPFDHVDLRSAGSSARDLRIVRISRLEPESAPESVGPVVVIADTSDLKISAQKPLLNAYHSAVPARAELPVAVLLADYQISVFNGNLLRRVEAASALSRRPVIQFVKVSKFCLCGKTYLTMVYL